MKYTPTNTGSTVGAVTGGKVSYKKGVPTDDLPKGELDHCGFEPVDKTKFKNPEKQKSTPEKDDEATVVSKEDAENTDLDDRFLNLPDDTEFPHHYGAGNYYLSNGEKVNGKDEALEAQAEIDK